jgi:D-psicose/D-tagatose/L-ribulose 3-epimerase
LNKVGIVFAYWVRNWEDTDYHALASKARRLGFDILEIDPSMIASMDIGERDRLRGEAADHGLEFTYISGLTLENSLTSPDRAVRAKGIEFLISRAELISHMGGKALSGVLHGSWPTSEPESVRDKPRALDRSVESFREVIKAVEDNDISFNIEVANRFEQFLINTSQEAIEYAERVGSKRCRVLLDTFHMNIEEDSFTEAIGTAGDRLGHFHLGETNRKSPGRGKIPWHEVFSALSSIQYQGPLVMEPFILHGGSVGRDVRLYRDLLGNDDLDREAERACAFVRKALADVAEPKGENDSPGKPCAGRNQ